MWRLPHCVWSQPCGATGRLRARLCLSRWRQIQPWRCTTLTSHTFKTCSMRRVSSITTRFVSTATLPCRPLPCNARRLRRGQRTGSGRRQVWTWNIFHRRRGCSHGRGCCITASRNAFACDDLGTRLAGPECDCNSVTAARTGSPCATGEQGHDV